MKRKLVLTLLLALCGVFTANAADINVSTLGAGTGGDTAGSNISGGADRLLASQFSVGAQSSDITKVTLRLSNTGNNNYDLTQLTAYLYSDNSNQPGTQVASFFTTGTLVANSNQDFIGTLFTLNANTNYWLVLKSSVASDANNSVDWRYTQSSTLAPVSGFNGVINTIAATSANNGSSWTIYTSPNTTFYNYRISNVPEPSTYALGMIATGVLGGLARRRKKV